MYLYFILDHATCHCMLLQTMSHVFISHFRPCSMYPHLTSTFTTACDCRPRSACPHRECLVAGFFENKEADAKARGQKLPKKKDPKQEYDNFLKSIADDVQEVEARQDLEAVEAAQDKADHEAFEHGCALVFWISCTSQSCVSHINLALSMCLMMCWRWIGSSPCTQDASCVSQCCRVTYT